MKKLSIEEKAKRYDEAIERAESIYNETAIPSATTKGICTYIFPELKENEDDRMVKFIKNQLFNIKKTITENYELDAKLTKAICWLEKQCEQKIKTPEESLGIDSDTYNKIVDECIYGEQKPAWSEEDEEIYRKCICAMRASACGFPEEEKFLEQVDNWLKSLKARALPAHAELSETNEAILDALIRRLEGEDIHVSKHLAIDCLKSVLRQKQRKHGDEHYELEEFAKIVRGNLAGISKAVQELFEAKYLQLTGSKMYGGFKD